MARFLLSKNAWRRIEGLVPLRYLVWGLESFPFLLLIGLSHLLGPDRGARLGSRVFGRLGPRTRKHCQVMANLEHAFPDQSREARHGLAVRTWENVGAVMAEYAHLGRVPGDRERFTIEVSDGARVFLDEHRPVIFVTGHIGNWEVAGGVIVGMGYPLTVIYSPQSNPVHNWLVQRYRTRLGCELVEKDVAIRPLVKEVRAGRSVALIPDQRVDSGQPVRFFDADALTTLSPAWLSGRLKVPLIPLRTVRTGPFRYLVRFEDPLCWDQEQQQLKGTPEEVTREINRTLEGWIRETPGQWMCTKRRWPKRRPVRTDGEAS